jgi:UDP-glucose 4-epimerase
MKRLWMSFFVFAVSCASSNANKPTSQVMSAPDRETAVAAAPTASIVVCEWETPIGTNIREQVCRHVEDVDAQHRDAQDMLQVPKAKPTFNK